MWSVILLHKTSKTSYLKTNKLINTKRKMKKLLLLMGMFLLSMNMMAMGTEPEKVDVKELTKITFDGDNVILHYKDGTTTATKDMAEVTIDLSSAMGIETLRQVEELKGQAVYNLRGQYVGNSVVGLPKGVYIAGQKKVIIK